MKTSTIIWVAAVSLIVIFCVIMPWHYYTSFNNAEIGLQIIDKEAKNVHSSILMKMRSEGLVAEKYFDTVIKALEVGMSGRYGKNGSHAAMQWIHEAQPEIPASVLSKLQVVIEAGYNEFQAVQTTKLAKVEIYRRKATNPPGVIYAHMMGFPRKSWDELSRIVITAETREAFAKGEMKVIDPFKKDAFNTDKSF